MKEKILWMEQNILHFIEKELEICVLQPGSVKKQPMSGRMQLGFIINLLRGERNEV